MRLKKLPFTELLNRKNIPMEKGGTGSLIFDTIGLKKLAKECGYKFCFTAETSNLDLTRIDRNSITRRCVNNDAGFFEALSKIYGIWYKIKK
jgi:hypothetical protein